ncbi:MAG: DUF362 domain-containing protein [Candidatus Lokiarchaeota archaeon]|nr:DUF362 domain-containing protein [Candidatus Lokiarchaeota archaeon]MBD3199625.1 DUF362 domain-containing protein [Candidatus Lokiarchaeota archaeon]
MTNYSVSIVKYEKPHESVQKAVNLIDGLGNIPEKAKVFVKPNVVYWNRHCDFPKWGMITTSRVVEDIITMLHDKGITDITIGEGVIVEDQKDTETAEDAFEKLGYFDLKDRFGIKVYNIFERPFEKVNLTDEVSVRMNSDMLKSDYLVDLPVLKTHAQCVVSLGIKNLKGLISIASRKKFHSADPEFDLHYNVAQLANKIPPCLTILDGIYTLERGPAMDGKAHRNNILVASNDILSADLVGSNLLGIDASAVPYLVHTANDHNRPTDLSDIEIKGASIEDLSMPHEWDYIYKQNDTLPLPYAKAGIEGIKYHKYDETMCTFCSFYNGIILTAIKSAYKGKPFDNIEVLTGKVMEPTEGMNKTILVGQCQYAKNRDHPNINELIAIKGCPPSADDIKQSLRKAGIRAPTYLFKNLDNAPLLFLQKYKGKEEFSEEFFQVA